MNRGQNNRGHAVGALESPQAATTQGAFAVFDRRHDASGAGQVALDGATSTTRDHARRLRLAVTGLRGLAGVIGGIEVHSALLYSALAQIDPDLEIHVLTRARYGRDARTLRTNLSVRPLWAPRHGTAETLVHTPFAILIAARMRADVVHLHGIGPAFFAPLARALGMRVVVTHHASDFSRPKWGLGGRIFLRTGEALAARFANRVICVSAALKTEFLKRHPVAADRTVIIRHGVSLAPVTPAEAEAVYRSLGIDAGHYFLAVGRLEETKRFDDLIAAHAKSRSTMPLVIVGSTYNRSAYAERLRTMAHAGVRFAGYREGAELSALYRGAALLLHPSAMEGFALVVAEALVTDTPVAISDIPVHREFGLPDDSYFTCGDQNQMTAIMDATVARTIAHDAVDGHADMVVEMALQHQRVFREVGGDVGVA